MMGRAGLFRFEFLRLTGELGLRSLCWMGGLLEPWLWINAAIAFQGKLYWCLKTVLLGLYGL